MRRIAFLIVAALLAGAATTATTTLLPTGWQIVAPSSPPARVGLFPQGIALSPDGTQLAVVDSGVANPDVRILDARTLQSVASIDMTGVFGKPVWMDATHVLVAGQNADAAFIVDIPERRAERIDTGSGTWPAAVALSNDGRLAATSNDGNGTVAIFDPRAPHLQTIAVGKHPSDLAFAPDGRTLYVALRGERSVAAVDTTTHAVRTFETGDHPDALLVHGTHVGVANADDDSFVVLDARSGRIERTVDLRLRGSHGAVYGASPNALAESGGHVYVSLGQENAVAVIDETTDAVRRIPAGWYPSGVAVAGDGSIFVADAKGEESPANPHFNPLVHNAREGYTGTSLFGSIRVLHAADAVNDAELIARTIPQTPRVQSIVCANGPIRHVIYIIKENRTYDQVLGDLSPGDGDPQLTMFGAAITPNEHALATRFGTFDNLYADAQVSADGHNWSTAAFANDYLERMWPPQYGGRRELYDFEDGAGPSIPHNGYIWNAATRAHVSFRDYGEFVSSPRGRRGMVTSAMPDLGGHIDPLYPGFDLVFSDLDRVAEWQREFEQYVRRGDLPQLELIRLPNDHTAGTRPGSLTPQAYVAQNDEALGRLIDVVSHSKYWRSTAIFTIEDDAQNGPDHVDNQRTTFYVASPYARPGVHHRHYSTASVLRTIELLLGLPPMSAYDAYAEPLDAAFAATPDLKPYVVIPPKTDIRAVNERTAYGAAASERMNFRDADAADETVLNDILEHAAHVHSR